MELEELQSAYLKLQDDYKKQSEEKQSLEERNKVLEEEKLKLQNTNHELFLRVTSPQENNDKKESEEKRPSTDAIVEIYKKEHNIK